jgi:hypothetical protein
MQHIFYSKYNNGVTFVTDSKPVGGVLDEPFSQLTPLSGGAAVQARQSIQARTVSILCSLAGRYSYSAELA